MHKYVNIVYMYVWFNFFIKNIREKRFETFKSLVCCRIVCIESKEHVPERS